MNSTAKATEKKSVEYSEKDLQQIQMRIIAHDPQALNDMYNALQQVALKTINTIAKGCKKVKEMEIETRRVKAHDAATYIIEQYIKRPLFKIDKSINGYLYKRVEHELFYVRNCDKLPVYVDEIDIYEDERKEYKFICTNIYTGEYITFETLAELRIKFDKLRISKLRELIRTGQNYKGYVFDLYEG